MPVHDNTAAGSVVGNDFPVMARNVTVQADIMGIYNSDIILLLEVIGAKKGKVRCGKHRYLTDVVIRWHKRHRSSGCCMSQLYTELE